MPYNSKEKLRAYLIKNKKRIKVLQTLRSKRWQEKNKEKAAHQRREWARKNKDKMNAYKIKWARNNRDKRTVWEAHRRALKFRATVYLTTADKKEIENMYKLAQDKTKDTGFQWHVDHIVPLTKGGLHKPTNLQVVPARWNIRKRNYNCNVYIEA